MNGPEHYREAERLLTLLADPSKIPGLTSTNLATGRGVLDLIGMQAQTHATLALAAATAGHRTTWGDPGGNTTSTYVEGEWAEVFA